jgi:enhancing lycopene biosynthesis protein 2
MRIGILLGGCGHYDGTDVNEAVLTLLALEAAREKPVLLAPEVPQERIVDHLTGDEVEGAARDVLRESARLARGAVRSLSQVRAEDLEALIIPGGYGPVVNFSAGFARPGRPRALLPDVAAFIRHFVDDGKPIGTISLGEIPLRTVLGEEIDLAPPPADPRSLSVDPLRRLVHTPGFSGFTRLADVKAGIEAMVERLLLLLEERSGQAAGARPSPGEA